MGVAPLAARTSNREEARVRASGESGEDDRYQPDPLHDGPPYEGGSQPVPERPTPPPSGGSSVTQTVILIIGALAVIAAILWILVPLAR
jgi:hypothetical protein